MTTPPKPFLAADYELQGGLTLGLMTPDEAKAAGAISASIEPWRGYALPQADVTAFLATTDADAPRFAVRSNGSFAGALVVRRNWFCGPYVQMLMIVPHCQGRGFGSALLRWVETEARLGSSRNLWIAVTSTNAVARKLYERTGFTLAAELDGLVADGKTELLLRKRLT